MGGAMARYKFKGYTITNCGYHQPDHCVWWEAVDENGEACFHGNTLREVEFEILDYEWEQKMKKKDEEIERLKRHARVGNALSAPPRNCDVGTAEEQAVRFDAFVRDRRGDLNCTGKCPAHNGVDFGVVDCVLQWAQMPYAAER